MYEVLLNWLIWCIILRQQCWRDREVGFEWHPWPDQPWAAAAEWSPGAQQNKRTGTCCLKSCKHTEQGFLPSKLQTFHTIEPFKTLLRHRCTCMMRLWCWFESLFLWVCSWDGPAQPVHILINRHVPAVKCVAQTDLKATLFLATTDQTLWSYDAFRRKKKQ